MRFVVMGAGAVGGAVGGRLAEHGHDVVLVARGEHGRVMRDQGLTLRSPEGVTHLRPVVVADVREVEARAGDVVLFTVKSQDTFAALAQLGARFPTDTPVLCLQNGVFNESMVLRTFSHVYGVPVMLPAVFLEPGVVDLYASPVPGILDVGRFPTGVDDTAEAVAAAFRSAGFDAVARDDVMAWKWTKLLTNLPNAAIALCSYAIRKTDLLQRLRAEATACFTAAGIAWIGEEESERRHAAMRIGTIDGHHSPGGSTYQSMARGREIETEFLNGEIVLLGRLHGVPTPVNEGLQRLLRVLVASGAEAGSMSAEEVVAALGLDTTAPSA